MVPDPVGMATGAIWCGWVRALTLTWRLAIRRQRASVQRAYLLCCLQEPRGGSGISFLHTPGARFFLGVFENGLPKCRHHARHGGEDFFGFPLCARAPLAALVSASSLRTPLLAGAPFGGFCSESDVLAAENRFV